MPRRVGARTEFTTQASSRYKLLVIRFSRVAKQTTTRKHTHGIRRTRCDRASLAGSEDIRLSGLAGSLRPSSGTTRLWTHCGVPTVGLSDLVCWFML